MEDQTSDHAKKAMAVLAQAAVAAFDNPPVQSERRGSYVVDLNVGDIVCRFASEFGRVTKRAHEADDLLTGQAPTVQEYVTIQWGHSTAARYTNDTLESYGIKKVDMPA